MPDFLTQDIELFISTREGAFNTPVTVGTNYDRATTQSPAVYIPEPEFSNDAGRAGNASEFATGRCLRRFLPETIGITDRANFGLYGKLAMRCVGGAPLAPVTLVAVTAFQHAANMLPKSAGLQLPSFNAVTAVGGASFLWPGVVVDSFAMSQQGDDDVQVQFSLVGSGKHRRPHLIGVQQVETATAVGTIGTSGNATVIVTAAGMSGSPRTVSVAVTSTDTATVWAGKVRAALTADPIVNGFFVVSGATTAVILTARATAPNDTTMNLSLDNGTCTGITPALTSANTTAGSYTLPAAPAFACLNAQPFLQYTDPGGLQDLTATCRWRAWSVAINNNHSPQRDRCGGDQRQKRGDYTVTTGVGVGAYLQKLSRGPRTITAEITYLVDENLAQWEALCDSVQLTGVIFGARGALLDGAGPTYEALKVVIPKAKFGVLRGADSDGFAAFTLSFETEFDTTAIGARIEVINGLDGVSPLYN